MQDCSSPLEDGYGKKVKMLLPGLVLNQSKFELEGNLELQEAQLHTTTNLDSVEGYDLDVLAPFDFKTNPSWLNTNYKVLLVSTEVTYFVCGFLFVLVVEEWVWDYAISVTILHVAITSTVMLEFPLTSHWWAALGSGLILMIMWRPDFSILFIQRQLYLSRSGRVLKEQLN
nr:transmembrane protein 244 [Equus asinus]